MWQRLIENSLLGTEKRKLETDQVLILQKLSQILLRLVNLFSILMFRKFLSLIITR